jgi:hypothetical protein
MPVQLRLRHNSRSTLLLLHPSSAAAAAAVLDASPHAVMGAAGGVRAGKPSQLHNIDELLLCHLLQSQLQQLSLVPL